MINFLCLEKNTIPIRIQISSIRYDSLPKCTPFNPGIGMSCRITKIVESIAPNTAMNFNSVVPSLSRFITTKVEVQVKKKPMEAPMADMSTNQPRASLPSMGPDKEIRMQNNMAFLGVPYRLSILQNILGR